MRGVVLLNEHRTQSGQDGCLWGRLCGSHAASEKFKFSQNARVVISRTASAACAFHATFPQKAGLFISACISLLSNLWSSFRCLSNCSAATQLRQNVSSFERVCLPEARLLDTSHPF